jgi:hypothetical protein
MFVPLFFSCSDDKKVEKQIPPEPQVKSAVQVDPKVQKLEELKKAPTKGLDALQNMLPAEMSGIKRSKFSMTSNLGYATAQADYEKNSKTYIHLALYDCAGEQGSALYNNSFLSSLDKNEQNDAGYTKTIELNGGKAIEKYEAATKVTTISYLGNDQILVVVAGKNIPAETLKEAISKMNMKIS